MMVAGLMAALTILLSPGFKHEASQVEVCTPGDTSTRSGQSEAKDDAQLVAVSADAVTSSAATEVESVNPYVVQEIIAKPERPTSVYVRPLVIPVSLIASLLKAVISPQAP